TRTRPRSGSTPPPPGGPPPGRGRRRSRPRPWPRRPGRPGSAAGRRRWPGRPPSATPAGAGPAGPAAPRRPPPTAAPRARRARSAPPGPPTAAPAPTTPTPRRTAQRRSCGLPSRSGLRGGGRDQVAGGPGVDLDAGAHRGGDGDALDVAALGRGRLGAEDLVQHGLVVLDQGPAVERGLAQDQVQVAVPVDPVLDLAPLDVGTGPGTVG